MEFGLYIIYAFIQAILIARYILREKDAPVFAVLLMAAFAPIATILTLGFFVNNLIVWAVTGKRPKFRAD